MTPLFILYSILISAIFIFLLGVWVWLKNPKLLLNKIFLLLTITSVGIFFGSYMMLKNCESSLEKVVFWDRFLYIFVVFIPVVFYHFILVITNFKAKKSYKKLLFLGYLISFFFLIISRTDYFIKGVFQYKYGCHTTAQLFHHLFLIFFLIYVALFYGLLVKAFLKEKGFKKNQLKYILIAIFFYSILALGFLPAYKISIYPFYYLGPLMFTVILSYAITRYKFLNIKIITTEILVLIILLVFSTQIFLSKNSKEIILRICFFVIMIFFGIIVVKSTLKEVHQKEILEKEVRKRTKELFRAKKIAEEKAYQLEITKKELEKFYTLTVGRELKMVELKQKIKELERQIQKR